MNEVTPPPTTGSPLDQVMTRLIEPGCDFFAQWGPDENAPDDVDIMAAALQLLQDVVSKFHRDRFGRSKCGPLEFLPATLDGRQGWFLECQVWDESNGGEAVIRVFSCPGEMIYDICDM
jgi:hypothetical protein